MSISSKTITVQEYNQHQLNVFKKTYKDLRQASKKCTFALQYSGTFKTLMNNSGFSEEEAKNIVDNYKKLYAQSEQYKAERMKQAEKDGYITGAFGLRVRTPRIKQTVLGTKITPSEAEAEKRTACNAIFQSWCLLTSRAGIEVNQEVRTSKYRELISPCAQIHDAQYFLLKDDISILYWLHEKLVHAVEWQDDPMIAHPLVHLGGELALYWPNWSNEIAIPNHASKEKILEIARENVLKYQSEHHS